MARRRDQAGGQPVVVWHPTETALVMGGITIQAGEGNRCRHLINREDPARIEGGRHVGRPGRARYRVALGGAQRLFFRVQFSRLMARDIVAALTRPPATCSHLARNSSKGASWAARNWSTRAGCCSGGIARGRPGIGRGAKEPVSCTCRTQFLPAAGGVGKVRATRSLGS